MQSVRTLCKIGRMQEQGVPDHEHRWTVSDWMNEENERWVRWKCDVAGCKAEKHIESRALAGAAPA